MSGRGKKVLIAGIGLAGLGFVAALVVILLLDLLDQRIITAGDVTRVTGRRLIGRLDESQNPNEEELEDWALKQIRKISDTLQITENDFHEIGFLSAGPGEGKTTIIHALAHAAALRGRPVLTLTNGQPSVGSIRTIPLEDALNHPQDVETKLSQIPPHEPKWLAMELPSDWKWNLERRQRWVQAIECWRKIPKGTVLIEVPPHYSSDGILYAETLKHTLWVSSSSAQTASHVTEIISSLDHSHCQLSGAIINREPPLVSDIPLFSRWIKTTALITLFGLAVGSHAAETIQPEITSLPPEPTIQPSPKKTAAQWQRRLTLGPGDTINIGLYGYPNHFRPGVIVSPDGFVSYLQARNIRAQDRTVDELRTALDQALSKYFRSPRTMIMPREFLSKKYHIMGSVKRSGSYLLNRPVTIIEAVAQAEGMRTGLFDHNTIELADLERSFLARGDKRMDVDFKALFHQGDLSQNILLEPDDYIYIPSSSANEVYILGAITRPGAVGITTDATVMRLVAVRGGFLRSAYTERVLIIRGSWIKPETFIFNAKDVLNGKGADFVLRPKDVIFISERPWAKAEELLDLAARSFLQSATATWTGESVGPLIREALIK